MAARLCGGPMIVTEHPAEVFTTGDGAGNLTDLVARLDDRVGQALMIPLAMVVVEKGYDSAVQ